MPIPFVDLDAIHGPLHERIMNAIASVVRANQYILGSGVQDFERELAAFLNVKHTIGVSSGTDALIASLMALGVGPGDEVITSPFSFIASADAIARVGARPRFVDIEAESFNLDPRRLPDAISGRTKAIMPVHLFGRAADIPAINRIAAPRGIPVIEDAAQSIAAEWDGVRVGGLGIVGAFSFFPAKNLGALGDGGAISTNDDDLAAKLRSIRVHGFERRYVHAQLGGNFRLDALQAAVLRVKLPELEGWTATRQDNAFRYQDLFYQRALTAQLTLPDPGVGRHVYNQYVIRIPDGRRADVFDALVDAKIGCAVYYPIPLHLQPCFAHLGHSSGDFPVAEQACAEALALPIAPGLQPEQQEAVVDTIGRALGA